MSGHFARTHYQSMQVDGIFADQPDVVVEWRIARKQQVNGGNRFRLLNDRDPEKSQADK